MGGHQRRKTLLGQARNRTMPMHQGGEITAVLETAQHLLHPTPADAEQFG
jgi:hypothetical protein